ncbi:uncharacterized protein BJ212DRAFT_1307617, partial [Suillus subaureus]
VKADGLDDLLITTEDKLTQFSPARPTRQTFLIVRPWNRHDLGLPDFADDAQSVDDWSDPESPSEESITFWLLLAQQRGGEYKRIASDHNIIARVKDMAAIHHMMDVRILEIL